MVDLEVLGLLVVCLPLPCVRNQLIIVHFSRENGEVYGRPGGSGTAGSLPQP